MELGNLGPQLVAIYGFSDNRQVSANDLPHFSFNAGEVVGGKCDRAIKVVVKASLCSRADGYPRLGKQPLHGHG